MLTLINHFAYGGAAGSFYSAMETRVPIAAWLKGVVFGSAVWSASYFALLPQVGLLESAHQHPADRNRLMFAAHLIWGIVLAIFVDELKGEQRQSLGALVAPVTKSDRDQK